MCNVGHLKKKFVHSFEMLNEKANTNLQIADPDVYIRAQVDAVKQRHNTCSSYVLTIPVALPQIICKIIPVSIT